VDLHRQGQASVQVQQQEEAPTRKVYTITDEGLAELRQWLLSEAQMPELKDHFLIQLAWADQLSDEELDALLAGYAEKLQAEVLMLRETLRRGPLSPQRTTREAYLWRAIYARWL